ncbi:hypothetical protein RO03_11440 [Fusobacterium nucleatum subsp. nucleatum]|uniref:Lipoprotein n=1 Tax=Fusobacterium nucleatum subsp. nucleatum TaxID=76856 RepID=A0A101K5B3_FUSNC|nr:hypothetical protein [Fusobacterium nucleatum]ALF23342.1 hypothetical protein RO05_02705 [Fusobacterium nucleatum subsp. nucleatum ChDC F316]KUL97605.1 hypothetical protein RO03_11440 [Fusobacterium nucleatum subsp. nucleatum]MCG6842550.1 hypothetical protein [Fusobacterium nucleatum]WMS29213.1 hypothetical protein RDV57_08910 [Fusobacterium nucleatum]
MLKRVVMLIVLGLIFSSCQLFTEAIKDNIHRYEIEETFKEYKKKDGSMAYQGNKEVFNIVKEVLKRPINKETQFDGIKIMIPENTRINSKIGTIIDIKTGYGLPISIYIKDYCDSSDDRVASKKRSAGGYYHINYLSQNKDTKLLFEKISKVNGFTKGCK